MGVNTARRHTMTPTLEPDRRISEALERNQGRLWNFIRRHVPDPDEAEDVLQEVFYELVVAYRLMKPIEHAGAWMFRVARNRIADLFRKRRPERLQEVSSGAAEGKDLDLANLLPSREAGPEALYARTVLIEELEAALDELPGEQREVFIAHELEGRSFRELSADTGVGMNTLLSRKHYAVLHLRRRLQDVHDAFVGT